jgi:LPS-assembly lipoprotein
MRVQPRDAENVERKSRARAARGRIGSALSASLRCVLLVGVVAGCGFEPLYGDKSRGGAAPTEAYMAAVRVDLIANRSGQELRNELLERLNQRGPPERPVYHLQVQLAVATQALGIQRDDSSRIGRVDVSSSFWLKEIATEKTVHSGSSRSITTYAVVQSNFANVQAANDATQRALREISDDIRTQLALYFTKS